MGVRAWVLGSQEMLRRGVTAVLTQAESVELVGELTSLVDACARAPRGAPDVVVVAVDPADEDRAVAWCRHLTARALGCPVLLLGPESESDRLAVLAAGAANVVPASTSAGTLVDAVRAVGTGQVRPDPTAARRRLRRRDPWAPLSPRERCVAELVAQGLTNREIARRLHLAEKTAKNYVSNILGKLKLHGRTQLAVQAAERRGLWLDSTPASAPGQGIPHPRQGGSIPRGRSGSWAPVDLR